MKYYDPVHDTSSFSSIDRARHNSTSALPYEAIQQRGRLLNEETRDGMIRSSSERSPAAHDDAVPLLRRTTTPSAHNHRSHALAAAVGAIETSSVDIGASRESRDAELHERTAPRVGAAMAARHQDVAESNTVHRSSPKELSAYSGCDGIVPEHEAPRACDTEADGDMSSYGIRMRLSPTEGRHRRSIDDDIPPTSTTTTTSRVAVLPSVSSIVATLKQGHQQQHDIFEHPASTSSSGFAQRPLPATAPPSSASSSSHDALHQHIQQAQSIQRSHSDGLIQPSAALHTHAWPIAAAARRRSSPCTSLDSHRRAPPPPGSNSSTTASPELLAGTASTHRRFPSSTLPPSAGWAGSSSSSPTPAFSLPSTSRLFSHAAAPLVPQQQQQQQQQAQPLSVRRSGAASTWQSSMPKKREQEDAAAAGAAEGVKVKKKRIQQACKLCGVKRVKCDGGHPCATCVRSGETCEYGQPKKRGPPKGSVRSKPRQDNNKNSSSNNNNNVNVQRTGHFGSEAPSRGWGYRMDESRSVSPRGGETSPMFRSSGANTRQASPVSSYSASQNLLALGTPAIAPPAHTLPQAMGVGSVFALYAEREEEKRARYTLSQPQQQQLQQQHSQPGPSRPMASSQLLLQSPTGAVGPRDEFNRAVLSPVMTRADEWGRSYARMPDSRTTPGKLYYRPSASGTIGAQPTLESSVPPMQPMPSMPTPELMSRPLDTLGSTATAAPVIPRRPGSLSGPAGWRPDMGPSPRSGLTSPSGFSLQHLPPPSVSTPSESAERSRDENAVEWSEATFADRALATFFKERKRASSMLTRKGEAPRDVLRRESIDRERPRTPDADTIALRDPHIPAFIFDRLWLLIHKVILPHWCAIDSTKRVDEEAQPLLFNALCALAAASWDPQVDAPQVDALDEHGTRHAASFLSGKELSSIFFVRARYYLLRANNESSHELIAALIYMSLYEGGAGRLDSSAQFSGMASRACLDLGLHRAVESSVHGRSLLPGEDQARGRLFWTAYVLDQCISAQLGKPPTLRELEADCPYPVYEERNEAEEYQTWVPDMAHLLPDKSIMDRLCTVPLHAVTSLIFEAKLATCCEAIIAQYNTVKSKVDPATRLESTEQTLARLHRRVMQWHEERPAFLRWEDASQLPLPHILCQNLWHATCLIILHRPHIMHNKRGSSKDMPLSSHAVCTKAAATVCSIVSKHEELYGMRKLSSTTVYCLFTACTISVANTTSPDAQIAAQAKEQLRKAFKWLSRISEVWRSAAHHLRLLQRLGRGINADLEGTGLDAHLQNRMDSLPTTQHEYKVDSSPVSLPSSAASLPAMQAFDSLPGSNPAFTMGYPAQPTLSTAPAQLSFDGPPQVQQMIDPHSTMPMPTMQQQQQQQHEPFVSSYPQSLDWSYGTTSFNAAPESVPTHRTVQIDNSLTDSAAYLAAADAYWSCMPLASEDSRSWEAFTSSYLSAFSQLNAPSKSVIPPAPLESPEQTLDVSPPLPTTLPPAPQQSPTQTLATSPSLPASRTSSSADPDRAGVRWATDRSTLEGA